MDEAEFWGIVEDARAESQDDLDTQVTYVADTLKRRSPEEIAAFDRILNDRLAESYDWGLWGAAYVLNGGASNDGFLYFQAWLIAQGESVFDQAVRNPDSLAGHVRSDPDYIYECESLLYAARDAYEMRTGEGLVPPEDNCRGVILHEPRGRHWMEDDLSTLLPQLCARGAGIRSSFDSSEGDNA